MNCRNAEPLLPLLVEADLDAAEMQQVTTHVELCDSCRTLVAEFQASQSSLHAMALPAVDEAMLTAMRNAVQREIAPTISRPSITDWLSPFWNWKVAFAAAVVILLMSGIVLSRRDAGIKDDPVAARANEPALLPPPPETALKTPLAQTVFQPRMERKKKAPGGVRVSERNPGKIATTPSSPARGTASDGPMMTASIAPSEAENETMSLEKSTPEPEMLRMEIQTADPNIKIIWLTPKEPSRTNTRADTK